jgi:hypothetical protein
VGSTNLGTTPFSDITTAATTLQPLTIHGGQADEAVQDLEKIPEQIAGFEAKVEAMEIREDSLKYRQQSLREVKQRYTSKLDKLKDDISCSRLLSRICKRLRSPGIDSAYVAWRAGTSNRLSHHRHARLGIDSGSLKGLKNTGSDPNNFFILLSFKKAQIAGTQMHRAFPPPPPMHSRSLLGIKK